MGRRGKGAQRRVVPGDPQRVLGYVRVSTEQQELGPEAQREAITRWAESREAVVVGWYEDLGVSGDTPPDQRPGLMRAVADLAALQAGRLVAVARDRIAREPRLAGVVELAVEDQGARVVTLDDVDLDNPGSLAGRMTRAIKDVMAAEELASIRRRTKAALAVKKARGERVGSVPLGYMVEPGDPHLLVNDHEQAAITRAKHLHRLGRGLRAICRQLAEEGFATRTGGPWHPQTIKRLLQR